MIYTKICQNHKATNKVDKERRAFQIKKQTTASI